LKQKAHLLNVHLRNVSQAIKRQELLITWGFSLDFIIMQNKGIFYLSCNKGYCHGGLLKHG